MGRCPFDRCDGWCNGTGSCWDDSSADRTGTPGGTDERRKTGDLPDEFIGWDAVNAGPRFDGATWDVA